MENFQSNGDLHYKRRTEENNTGMEKYSQCYQSASHLKRQPQHQKPQHRVAERRLHYYPQRTTRTTLNTGSLIEDRPLGRSKRHRKP